MEKIARVFKNMDDSDNLVISQDELQKACKKYKAYAS
jgi:hypothetical protein